MKAVLLDRDGVINEDRRDYVKNISEFVILPGVPEAIGELTRNGFAVFVLSNQAGISKGLYSSETLRDIDSCLQREVEKKGGKIAKTYYCPHQDEDNCSCRKPKPGMFERLFAEYPGIVDSETYYVGDSRRDILAARKAGCRALLVLTGKARREDAEEWAEKPDHVSEDLMEAARWIISRSES